MMRLSLSPPVRQEKFRFDHTIWSWKDISFHHSCDRDTHIFWNIREKTLRNIIQVSVDVVGNVGRVEHGEKWRSMSSLFKAEALLVTISVIILVLWKISPNYRSPNQNCIGPCLVPVLCFFLTLHQHGKHEDHDHLSDQRYTQLTKQLLLQPQGLWRERLHNLKTIFVKF